MFGYGVWIGIGAMVLRAYGGDASWKPDEVEVSAIQGI